MLSDREKQIVAVIVVFSVIAGYFSLAWAGVLPEQYNIIEHYFGAGETGETAVFQAQEEPSVTIVNGIPETSIILNDDNDYSRNDIVITFIVIEGYCNVFEIHLDVQLTNATVTLVQTKLYENPRNAYWYPLENRHSAYYNNIDADLSGWEMTEIAINIVGSWDTSGYIGVQCFSNGYISQNSPGFHVYVP